MSLLNNEPLSKKLHNTLITAFAILIIPGTMSIMGYAAKSYADNNYVSQAQFQSAQVFRTVKDIKRDIKRMDDKIFEIDQEMQFAEVSLMPKWQTRKAYYERQKDELIRELRSVEKR